jgi:hypothetical protein
MSCAACTYLVNLRAATVNIFGKLLSQRVAGRSRHLLVFVTVLRIITRVFCFVQGQCVHIVLQKKKKKTVLYFVYLVTIVKSSQN